MTAFLAVRDGPIPDEETRAEAFGHARPRSGRTAGGTLFSWTSSWRSSSHPESEGAFGPVQAPQHRPADGRTGRTRRRRHGPIRTSATSAGAEDEGNLAALDLKITNQLFADGDGHNEELAKAKD